MSRLVITDYVFDPAAGTLVLNQPDTPVLEQIMSVRNTTRDNRVMYLGRQAPQASLGEITFHFPVGSVHPDDEVTDDLLISYETDPVNLGSVGPAATNAGTTQTLVNNIRAALIAKGILQ